MVGPVLWTISVPSGFTCWHLSFTMTKLNFHSGDQQGIYDFKRLYGELPAWVLLWLAECDWIRSQAEDYQHTIPEFAGPANQATNNIWVRLLTIYTLVE